MVALVLVPAAAGSLRPIELAGGPTLIPGHASMTASPVPVVVHIVSAIPYAVLGAFQFCRRFRRRWPAWQCAAGHVLVVLGLALHGLLTKIRDLGILLISVEPTEATDQIGCVGDGIAWERETNTQARGDRDHEAPPLGN